MKCFLSIVLIICLILLYSFVAWKFIDLIKRNYKEGKTWAWWNFYSVGVILLGLNLISIEIGTLIHYCE